MQFTVPANLAVHVLSFPSLLVWLKIHSYFRSGFRLLGRIFGRKRDEVTGSWRKLHDEELHGLYSSPSIVRVMKARRMRWAGHMALMGKVRGAYNVLVGRPEGRRPLGRREIGFGDVDWIHLAQDSDKWPALVNTLMNLRFP
jgi:hypothetical protein